MRLQAPADGATVPHRYVQFADASVAALLEDLVARVGPEEVPVRGLRAATDAMTAAGHLDRSGGFALTDAGVGGLTGPLGVPVDASRHGRRPVARGCLDWTERRKHLGGLAGGEVCSAVLARGWVVRVGTGRAVRVRVEGAAALSELLGVFGLDDTPL